jgi:hypothetical protein
MVVIDSAVSAEPGVGGPAQLRTMTFPAGPKAPKVDARIRFVTATGRSAAIGALRDAAEVLAATAGTTITAPTSTAGTQPRDVGQRDQTQIERARRDF